MDRDGDDDGVSQGIPASKRNIGRTDISTKEEEFKMKKAEGEKMRDNMNEWMKSYKEIVTQTLQLKELTEKN